MKYDAPSISDLGDLTKLTAGCLGGGPPDAAMPTDPQGYPDQSPAFGDPGFCE
jgi:hypothetical protein